VPASNTQMSKSAIRYTVIALVLLLLLGGLTALYIALSQPARVTEEGSKDRNYLFSIYGFEGDLLRRPSAVAIAPNGDIHVADTGKRRVVVFDRSGAYVTTYGEAGDQPLQLWEPLGVAVAPDGRSFVVDKSKNKIVVFDANHRASKVITLAEEAPISARIANGNLFVTTESGVLIADLDGNLQVGYIKRGKAKGEFDRPGSVAVDADGTLYVADSLNYRVQALGRDGKVLWTYGKPLDPSKSMSLDTDTGQTFGLPASIAVDTNGFVYVVDGLNSEITVLDTKGEFIEKIGDVGHDDGKFYYPDGIDYADGRLAIADKYNDRVQVFSVPASTLGAAAWLPYAPWALLIALLPLGLFLLRRGTRYVVTPAFVAAVSADEQRDDVVKALRRVFATEQVVEAGSAIEGLKLAWVARQVSDESVDALVERFGLDRDEAAALAVAVGLRGKRVVLTDSEAVRSAALELGLAVVAYDEVATAVRGDKAAASGTDAGGEA